MDSYNQTRQIDEHLVYEAHAELCKVLTDPKRLRILNALREGELSVNELARTIFAEPANTSQHLGVLRRAGVVATRREGTVIYYRLAQPRLVEACRIVHEIVLEQLSRASRMLPTAGEMYDRHPSTQAGYRQVGNTEPSGSAAAVERLATISYES